MTNQLQYDATNNTYRCVPSSTWAIPTLPADYQPVTVERVEHTRSEHVLLLRNVLSPSECDHFIKETEQLQYKPMIEYDTSYRSNTRVIVWDSATAKLISQRIADHVPKEWDDIWNYATLNECFRFCKYTPGQHFKPHKDGNFMRDIKNRSFLTFMIYLNDLSEEQGGTTRFLTNSNNVISAIKPEAGMALVFPHNLYHDGERLKSGVKYLMRSDLMYQRP